ncbi:MAG: hypothetical protein WCI88_01775 [Chloroflexota bacterium]
MRRKSAEAQIMAAVIMSLGKEILPTNKTSSFGKMNKQMATSSQALNRAGIRMQ